MRSQKSDEKKAYVLIEKAKKLLDHWSYHSTFTSYLLYHWLKAEAFIISEEKERNRRKKHKDRD